MIKIEDFPEYLINYKGNIVWSGGYVAHVYDGDYPNISNTKVLKTTKGFTYLLFKK